MTNLNLTPIVQAFMIGIVARMLGRMMLGLGKSPLPARLQEGSFTNRQEGTEAIQPGPYIPLYKTLRGMHPGSMATLEHITDARRVPAILEEGLTPRSHPTLSSAVRQGIYLAEDAEFFLWGGEVGRVLREAGITKYAVLEVSLRGDVLVAPDIEAAETVEEEPSGDWLIEPYAIVTYERISPENIRLIKVGKTEDLPVY